MRIPVGCFGSGGDFLFLATKLAHDICESPGGITRNIGWCFPFEVNAKLGCNRYRQMMHFVDERVKELRSRSGRADKYYRSLMDWV